MRLPVADEFLTADWVFPGYAPPHAGARLRLGGGRIVAIEPVRGGSGNPTCASEWRRIAVIPGLVNAHTHLEFSDLDAPLLAPGVPLGEWIARLLAYRRQQASAGSVATALGRGIRESVAAGVTILGEIAQAGHPTQPLEAEGGPAVCRFLELLGLNESRYRDTLAAAAEHVAARRTCAVTGLSPHAPYTVAWELLERTIDLSQRHGAPLAMHVAETREELELLASGTGPLVEMLAAVGAWQPERIGLPRCPLDYLKALARAPRALVVHGNYLDGEALDFLAQHSDRLSLVYCPRTHTYFRHAPYPLADALQRGVRVAIGTDSRASSPDLDLLAELRHVRQQHPQLSAAEVLRLGTLAGAEALGLAEVAGTLEAGKRADFVVLSVDAAIDDPFEAILAPSAAVQATYVAGRCVYRAEG